MRLAVSLRSGWSNTLGQNGHQRPWALWRERPKVVTPASHARAPSPPTVGARSIGGAMERSRRRRRLLGGALVGGLAGIVTGAVIATAAPQVQKQGEPDRDVGAI